MSPPEGPSSAASARPSLWPISLGFIVAFGGMLSYFLFFVFTPALRDFPWVNLPLVLIGVGLALIGLRNSFHPSRGWIAKIFAGVSLLLTIGLAGLFCTYIFYLSYQLPDAAEAVAQDAPAPAISLLDQQGEEVQLASFQGKRVVISFYRGHW